LFGEVDEFFAAVLMRYPFFWDMRLDILVLECGETINVLFTHQLIH
jgi:hypothetical protein